MNREHLRQTVLLRRARRWQATVAAGGSPHHHDWRRQHCAELPAVIRPRPVSLAELEVLAAASHALLRPFVRHPQLIESVATFVHARDPAARQRFPSRDALLAHLQGLLRVRCAS